MSKNGKILLGVLSFIPAIGIIIYLTAIFDLVFSNIGTNSPIGDDPEMFLRSFLPALITMGIASFIGFALFVYFLVCAIKDKSANENDRLLWVLILVFVSFFAFPFFWYFRIWSNPNFDISTNVTTNYNN